jgi:hypothetical protein
VANITVSRISPEKLRKIRVFQEDAYLSLDYQAQEGFIYRLARQHEHESSFFKKLLTARDQAIVSEFAGKKIVREPVEIEKGEPLKRELASFLECASAGTMPKVSGHQATAALGACAGDYSIDRGFSRQESFMMRLKRSAAVVRA